MADEQVGNNSYLMMTPGSAVAGQLQNILAQKRLEARQAMLDDLNRRNVESEISTREENAASSRMNRENMASDRNAQELGRRTDNMSPDQPLVGSDLEYLQKNAPSMVIPGETATDPLAPGVEGPSRPEVPSKFYGKPKQLEDKRKLQVQQDAIKQLNSPEFANMDTAQKAFIYEQATGKEPAAGLINAKKDDWVEVMGADGTPTGNWAPANAHFLQREPKEPTPPGMTPFQGLDESDNPVNLGYNPRTNSYEQSKVPAGLRIVSGSKGNAAPKSGAGAKPEKTTPQTWNLWTQALQGALKGKPEAEAQLNQQAAKIALELGISPEASKPVLDAFRTPANRARTPSFQHDDKAASVQAEKLWMLLTNGFKTAPQE